LHLILAQLQLILAEIKIIVAINLSRDGYYCKPNCRLLQAVTASLEDKIINTGEQINYLEDRVRYYKSRNWTNFITLEPIKLIQNIFGGGDVQRNQLTITDIETKINQLKDNQDRLENQLIIEKDNIKNEVAIALLNIQESRERIKLINQKRAKVKLQSQVFLIKYSNGEGTTNQYLNYQENIDRLDFDLLKATNGHLEKFKLHSSGQSLRQFF
jgi:hypothetical protein